MPDRSPSYTPKLVSLILIALGVACRQESTGPVLAGGRELKSWVADLHHKSAKVRRLAILKLGNVGDAEPVVVESLTKALEDPDPLVRRDAIMGIVKFKQPTQQIRDQLQKLSRMDRDASVRDHATQALGRLQSSQ